MSTPDNKKIALNIDIGKRLRVLRKSRKLKLREMAQIAGVSPGHMSNIESGNSGVGVELIIAVATECGVGVDWILYGTGEMNISRAERLARMRQSAKGYKDGKGEPLDMVAEEPAGYSVGSPWKKRLQKILDEEEDAINRTRSNMRIPLGDILKGIGQRIEEEGE